MLIIVVILIESGHAPFDLIEAESEIIDGLTTDIGGLMFSLIFAADVMIDLINLKLLFIINLSMFYAVYIYIFCIIYLWLFGRISFARWRQYDTIDYLLITWLVVIIYFILGF